MSVKNEILDVGLDETSGLTLNINAIRSLTEASKWSMFIGIVGMVLTVLMIVVSSVLWNTMSSTWEWDFGLPNIGLFGGVFILLAIVYFVPSLLLFLFSIMTLDIKKSNSVDDFNKGLNLLFQHFRYVVVISIASVVFTILLALIPAYIF